MSLFRIANISKIILALVIIFLFSHKLNSTIFVPKVYISGAITIPSTNIKSNYNSFDNTNSIVTKNYNNNIGGALAIGIRPLNMPFLSNIRLEAQVSGSFKHKVSSNYYGFAIYSDILRIIPFVNPYIGIAYYRMQLDLNKLVKNNYINDDYNKNSNAVSLNIGLNIRPPILNLEGFVEARYIGQSVKNIFNNLDNVENMGAPKYRYRHIDLLIGIKYYIL